MKVAMVFPGYGSQFVGMAKDLYDEHRIVQEYFEQACSCLDINFIKLCFASSDAEISTIRHGYTSLFLVSSSIAGLLKEQGIVPDVVAGYNIGDYAALFAADSITLPDGLYLLNKYANFYQELLNHVSYQALAVRGLQAEQIEDICFKANSAHKGLVFVAVYEEDKRQIVAGELDAIERVENLVRDLYPKRTVSVKPVDVGVGLHSPLMDPVLHQFRPYLEKVDFHDLSIPMMESAYGTTITHGIKARAHVTSRIAAPIMWARVVEKLSAYDVILEVGPGSSLTKTLQKQYPDKTFFTINKQSDVDAVKAFFEK